MMSSILVSLGYGSIIAHLLAFSSRNTHTMLKFNMLSTFFLGLSLIPFGAYCGTWMSFLSVMSKMSAFFGVGCDMKEFKKGLIGFFLGLLYFFFFNDEGWFGILPAVSMIFIVLADLQRNVVYMKYYYYGSAFCWLTYGIFIGSLAAILYDVLGILALSYSVYQIKKSSNLKFSNPSF